MRSSLKVSTSTPAGLAPAGGCRARVVAFGVPQNVPVGSRSSALATAWRGLPFALQLVAVVVTVTLAWILLDQSLATKRTRSAATYAAERMRLDRAEVLALDLFALMVDARATLTTERDAGGPAVEERLERLDRQVRPKRDSLRLLAGPDDRLTDAAVTWGVAYDDWRAVWRADSVDHRLEQSRFDIARLQQVALRRAVDADRRQLEELATDADRLAGRERLLLRVAAIGVGLFLIILVSRRVATTLERVVGAAEALAASRYDAVRLPTGAEAGSRELQRLAVAYEALARAVASREDALQREVRTLKEVEEMKTEFVSTVSHELRTPLTSIRGALGLVLSGATGPMPEQGAALMRIALTNTERLIRLINDMLSLDKAEALEGDAVADRVDVDPVVARAVAALDNLARERRVTIDLRAGSAAEILGSEDRLTQAVTNLLANALKYSPDGGTITVRTRRDAEQVLIAVTDQGPGIPEEFRDRMFGRFQQAHGAAQGTGLGLAITKRIADRLGGSITCESPEAGGTTFVLRFPVATRERASMPVAVPSAPTILLVDPDASLRDILAASLAPAFETEGVGSVADAIDRVMRGGITALVVEPVLPDGDGLDLVARIRAVETFHDLPVAIFTADDAAAQRAEAEGVPSMHIFRKAHDREHQLTRRLRAMLAARALP